MVLFQFRTRHQMLIHKQESGLVYFYTRAGVDENGQHWAQNGEGNVRRIIRGNKITSTQSFQFWKDYLYYEKKDYMCQYGCTAILQHVHIHVHGQELVCVL